jgi:hypothetical protein
VNAKPETIKSEEAAWRHFAAVFLRVFWGGAAIIFLIILLVDPYHVVPFSLPIERGIVSISQRHMYPQIVRSRRYDSLIIGTSTSRLLNPELLDKPFGVRFANMAMNAMTAWEQMQMVDLFIRTVGPPKVMILGLDTVWCDQEADKHRTFYGFPEWLYDDNPWNDYLYLFNTATAEITGREIGYQFGLYRARLRKDGYGVFVPPEGQYDFAKAQRLIWGSGGPRAVSDAPPPTLPPQERDALKFPALAWLDDALARLPSSSLKILTFTPVHVAAQPRPGTHAAAVEAECKARVAALARRHEAKLIDWRIASPITRTDTNYWDSSHYRVPIATRFAEEIRRAALSGLPSQDGSYRILVP